MSKSNALETAILALIYNATAITDLAENDPTSPATNIYVALHTGDPGDGGTQATSEAAYTSYARVPVVRTSSGWTVSGNLATNAADVDWPACTGGTSTVTHWSTGLGASGATPILHSGALTASLIVNPGITPSAGAGELDITED